jgi:hypothetical protein
MFQAIRYFERLLHDLDVICALSLNPVLDNVLHFIVQFQKTVPDLVPRAFLQVGHTYILRRPSALQLLCMTSLQLIVLVTVCFFYCFKILRSH